MFNLEQINDSNKIVFYENLNTYLKGLISGERDWLANISNASALLYNQMSDINWAGFYILKENELVLGPFQGKPACVRIPMGKGVCGTAAKSGQIQLVKDVTDFEGHIACDEASKSEVVLPIIKNCRLIGVLDIDSPITSRFDEQDVKGLKEFIEVLNQHVNWPDNY